MFTTASAYLSAFATKANLLWAGILLGIDLFATPTFSLFGTMWIAIGIDFLTGIVKAKLKGVARTSSGFRKTITKVMQYVIPVLIMAFMAKRIPEHKELLNRATGYLMMFIIYIEVTSIFENLYEIDQKTVIAKFIYKPALIILKLGIEKNAVVAAADKIQQQNKGTEPSKPE